MQECSDDLSIPLTCHEKSSYPACDGKNFLSHRVKKLSWEDELAAYNGGQVIIVVMDTSMMINMIIDHGHYSQA